MMNPEDQKLQDLQAQIDAMKVKTAPKPEKVSDESEAMSLGARAGTELVGTILVSGAIGYGLDRWLGTTPWILVVMLLLGITAAFYGVYKTTQNQGTSVGFKNLPKE